jgi:hypothetical protein
MAIFKLIIKCTTTIIAINHYLSEWGRTNDRIISQCSSSILYFFFQIINKN